MKKLNTIQEIHKVYDTRGSSPILVTCDDFNNWVCKYDHSSKKLFNELIASEFAKIWGINVPETSLIQVKIEHLPIKEDSESDIFLDQQSNKSVQERMVWQHLTLQKLNEMNNIPDKDTSDLGNG